MPLRQQKTSTPFGLSYNNEILNLIRKGSGHLIFDLLFEKLFEKFLMKPRKIKKRLHRIKNQRNNFPFLLYSTLYNILFTNIRFY